jgi:hypothetical protein
MFVSRGASPEFGSTVIQSQVTGFLTILQV